MDLLARLRLMPPGSLVPADWVCQQLEAEGPAAGAHEVADLTVEEVAEQMGRRPQTVRDWIRAGKLRGYMFRGKQYRVTRQALADFIEAERTGELDAPKQGSAPDLGSWRKMRKAS